MTLKFAWVICILSDSQLCAKSGPCNSQPANFSGLMLMVSTCMKIST